MSAHYPEEKLLGLHIDGRAVLTHILDKGGFGTIYKAMDIYYGTPLVAKVESQESKYSKSEAYILKDLNEKSWYKHGFVTEPIVAFQGFYHVYNHFIILMDVLGSSIRDLKKTMVLDKFNKTTSLWVGRKMLAAIKFVHECGWIHGDVKPSNFCLGLDSKSRQLFVIDYGVTRRFDEKNEGSPHKHGLFVGTARYASPGNHCCVDDGKIGDIWGIYFSMVECMLGQLPWRLEINKEVIRCIKKQLDNHHVYMGNLLHPWFQPPGPPPSVLLFLRQLLTTNSMTFDYDRVLHAMEYDMSMLGFTETNGRKLDWENGDPFEAPIKIYWNNPYIQN